jgi:hypothetical protein
VSYVCEAVKKGRQMKFENLHLNSIMPAHQIAQFYNANRGKDAAPASPGDFLLFKKFAAPEREIHFSDEVIATVQAISKTIFPIWIRHALPWGQLMGAKTAADPAPDLYWCCKQMVVVAPKILQGWIDIELAAFDVQKEDLEQVITLYDINNNPKIDIRVRSDMFGFGSCENERFPILKIHQQQEVLAHG